MNILNKALIILVACILPLTSQANVFDFIKPYAGAQAQHRNMDFEGAFGGNVFSEDFEQVDIFGGIKICQYLGIQGGYQSTENKSRTNDINELDTYLGIFIPLGAGIQGRETQTKISGWYADLIGFLPVSEKWQIDLFYSLGLIRNHLELEDNLVKVDTIGISPIIMRHYDEKKTMARASVGAQMTFLKYFGVKVSATWEDTSRFKGLKPQENPNASTNVNVKDSYIFGAGLFITTS